MLIKKLRYAKYYAGVLFRNWRSKKDSFAQHGEDLLVQSLIGKIRSFIDVGANDGVLFSNTYKFAKTGARGLCFEPSPSTFNKLRLNHLIHPRVKCFRQAVSDKCGYLPFVEEGYEATLSSIKPATTNHGSAMTVPAVTLSQMLNRFPTFRKIDLLSVDVEGHEREVFAGLGEKTLEASIIILEIDKSNIQSLLELPALRPYAPCYSNGLNLILSHHSTKHETAKLPTGFKPC
jgi:FkbM family methyltransferase